MLRMAAMRELSRAEAAPDQTDAGQQQQDKPDNPEIPVAQRAIGPRSQPRAHDRPGESDQRKPDHVRLDEAGAGLQAQRSGQYGEVEGLENPAPLMLAPAPHAGPQDWKRAGQSSEAAKDTAGKSDR